MTTARHEMRTDTSAAIAYGPRMSRPLLAIAAALALVLSGMPAAADDEPRFHRPPPRGFFERDGEALVVGVPAGGALRVSLEVSDPAVREAFVRIAYYDRATGRPRQIAIVDARAVRDGEHAALVVPLDAPPGAIAYRVRVLARLSAAETRSSPGAVRARLGSGRDRDAHARTYSRRRGEVPLHTFALA